MGLIWQFMAHMWERYGVVIGFYGSDMVANSLKIEAMGSNSNSFLISLSQPKG